jgi:hypothetical protein
LCKGVKYAIKHTNKKIFIYNEISSWMAENIMNNTIWSRELNKFIKYDGIKREKPIEGDGKHHLGGNYGNIWVIHWKVKYFYKLFDI